MGKRAWVQLPLLVIVLLAVFILPVLCRASVGNQPLIIATSTGSAPFEFVDKHHRPVGMFVDIWRLWAKKIGVEIKFKPVPWAQTLTLMKEGRADIHAGLFYSRKRDVYLDYGPELYASDTNIFFRRDISHIDKPGIANSYRVGVIKGDLAVAFLHRNDPGIRLTIFADNKALFNAVSNGTVKVFVKDTPIALYHLGRLHLLSSFHYRRHLPLYRNMFYAGVRQGDSELMAMVKKGMAMISPAEKRIVEQRWVVDSAALHRHDIVQPAKIRLSADELAWLRAHKKIRLGVDPSWPPFEFFGPARVYSGIASDYVKNIAARLGVVMQAVAGLSWSEVMERVAKKEIDVLPCLVKSRERSRYLIFSKPYLDFPMVIVTRSDFPMVSAVTDFSDNRLAVVQDYVSYDFIHRDFPNLQLKLMPSIDAALQAVSHDRIDGFVGNIAAVSYATASLGLKNIKVAAVTPYNFTLSMAVRRDWPELVPIINKAIAAMGKDKRRQIYKYWTRVRIEHHIDWHSVFWIGAGIGAFALLIIAIFVYWNRKLSLEIRRRRLLERELLKLSRAVEQLSASVIITDREGIIEYVNPHFSVLTGYTSGEVIGQNPRILQSGHHGQEFYASLWQTILAGKIWRGDFCNKNKNGQEYWESASIAPITDEHGNITHFVAVKDDISPRIEMENTLRRAKAAAEEATHAKSDFLAHMSHEIRTPMNAVMGMAHLCLQTSLSARQRDYLQKIILSARSLLHIINDVLDFSKIEAGKLSMEKVEFFLDEVLDNIASMTNLNAYEKGLELIFDRHANVPDGLVGDPLRLGQVLLNLVNNAIKFTDTGQVTVEIGVVSLSEKLVTIQCVVRDTGIGLNPQEQKRIFQPFSQADNSVTRRHGGTGLGLIICRRIVELMAGRIWVESTPGGGSAFFFTAILGRHRQTRKLRNLPNGLAGLRVLAVDDNETFLRVINEMLDSFGFRVTTAVSGEEAERILTGDNAVVVDLILMDWNLPGASGIETIHRLHRQLQMANCPAIILMTAYGDSEMGGSDNGWPLLLKPFTGSTLLDVIVNIFYGNTKPDNVNGAGLDRMPGGIAGCRILVAEDNHLNLQVVRELLQSWGALVDTVGDGAEVLDTIQKKRYDLVLLDIQMPKMDGLTAARKIRAMGGRYQKMPIIAMTAHVLSVDRQKSLAAGMNGHITKPLDPETLRQTLSRWLVNGNIEERTANAAVTIDECPAVLDCEAALRRLAGNINLYWQLLGEFCRDNKNKAAEIELALAQDDWHKARRLTHTLKGVSGNLGAMAVHNAAIRLEQAILGHDAGYRNLLTEINRHLEALFSGVERLIGGEKAVAAESVTLNKSDIDMDLRELLRLVQLHDIDAEALWTKLAPDLAEMFPAEIEDLGHKITNLDFTAAKRILTELMARMEVLP